MFPIPIGSMYGIYANIGGILMVNVIIYSIHGSYGIYSQDFPMNFPKICTLRIQFNLSDFTRRAYGALAMTLPPRYPWEIPMLLCIVALISNQKMLIIINYPQY